MKKRVLLNCVLVVIAIAMVGLYLSRPDALSEKVNSNCTIYFNRDALGGTPATIVPITCDNFNGAQVSLSGKLVKVTSEWIIIETFIGNDDKNKQMYWAPRNVVLLVRTGN